MILPVHRHPNSSPRLRRHPDAPLAVIPMKVGTHGPHVRSSIIAHVESLVPDFRRDDGVRSDEGAGMDIEAGGGLKLRPLSLGGEEGANWRAQRNNGEVRDFAGQASSPIPSRSARRAPFLSR